MRAIIFFQCVLIFFMNSQFVFSAEAASSEKRSKCLFGDDRKQARDVERALNKAIEKNDHATVYRYFLESRAQFTKSAPFMSLYTISSIGAFSAMMYFISDVSSDAVNQNEIQDYQIIALTLPALWSLISHPVVALQAPIVYRSYKTKEKAKAYLVKNLVLETFLQIEKLKLGDTLEELELARESVTGWSASDVTNTLAILNFMCLGRPFKNIDSTARSARSARSDRYFRNRCSRKTN